MYRTHRLVRLLAPLALAGSIATATPLAQAATAPQPSTSVSQHMPSPDLSITICIGSHCVTIRF